MSVGAGCHWVVDQIPQPSMSAQHIHCGRSGPCPDILSVNDSVQQVPLVMLGFSLPSPVPVPPTGDKGEAAAEAGLGHGVAEPYYGAQDGR